MKKYEIEINNEIYHVAVKELPADADMSSPQSAPDEQADTHTATEPSVQPAAIGDGSQIKAPMVGTILNVKVSAGQEVTRGETLVVLEAMKMENEIVAPADGVVEEIFVKPNDRVESGQVLLTI